jgi:hypothetical protein
MLILFFNTYSHTLLFNKSSNMEDIDVRKSEHDVREYPRLIKLENGLQALIVHNPRVVIERTPKNESIQMRLVSIYFSL